jgi:hypothetical protein
MDEKVQNIDGVIDEVNIVSRVGKESGKEYSLLQLILVDGYKLEVFTRERAELQLVKQLVEKLESAPTPKS